MSGRTKHKSRESERSSSKSKKKKSRKRSSSGDQVVAPKNFSAEDKKSEKRQRRNSSSSSDSKDSHLGKIKVRSQTLPLLREHPEFCRNGASSKFNSVGETLHRDRCGDRRENRKYSEERPNNGDPVQRSQIMENQRRSGGSNEVSKESIAKKSKKSRKRRRSSSSSSNSSSSSESSTSSSSSNGDSSSSSSSSSSSYEKRRRRRKKKKLAKKMKLAEKKKRKEKRKLKKIKEKLKETVKEIKHSIVKGDQDRLLKDINVELADRARAMAPMTKEQWEKKQSIIRRVYDEETGRHRLIKGDGEVLEEIVSRDRHMAINRQATRGDGEFFQSRLGVKK